MKKIIALILALMLCLTLCACSEKKNEENIAFVACGDAFNKITEVYTILEEYSQDICTAFDLGMNSPGGYDGYKGYDFEKYNRDEFNAFAAKMNIDQTYIEEAVVNISGAEIFNTGSWYDLGALHGGKFYSAWVSVISEAYICSGDAEYISSLLSDTTAIMQMLSENYSDYEHYPALKAYFTNALAYFDFCQNPEGSLEQIEEEFNNYQDVERDSFFDLNYIFEDSGAINAADSE